jgi:hypothetical protein
MEVFHLTLDLGPPPMGEKLGHLRPATIRRHNEIADDPAVRFAR